MSEWIIKLPELGLHQSFEGTPAAARAAAIRQAKEWRCKIVVGKKFRNTFVHERHNGELQPVYKIPARDYWEAEINVHQEKISYSGTGDRIPGTNADYRARRGVYPDYSVRAEDLMYGISFYGRVQLPPLAEIDPEAEPPLIAHLLPPVDLQQIARKNREIRATNKRGRFGSLIVSRVDGQHTVWPNPGLRSEYSRKLGGPVKDLICTGPSGRRIQSTEVLNEFLWQATHRYRKMRHEFYFTGVITGLEISQLSFEDISQLLLRSAFEQDLATKFANLQAYPLFVHKSGEAPEVSVGEYMSDMNAADRIDSFTARGRLIREELQRYTESPALFFFYSDWAMECRAQLPLIEDLADQYRGVNFVSVDVDEYESGPGIEGAASERGKDSGLAADFRITGLPTMVLLDAGREVERAIGVTSRQTLSAMIERVI
jgi:thiol-disulfide isomerase/thioredoxin